MSKFTITHLKAPWPLGAKVGDVVELAYVPAWALGKCSLAADDAEVTIGEVAPAALADSQVGPVDEDADKIAASLAEADAQTGQEKAAIEAKASTKPAKAGKA